MRPVGIACALVLCLAAGAEEKTSAVREAATTARIETMLLLNPHLNPFNINTTTSDGVVTLSGGVETEIQRELAGDLAATVEGVREVVNLIMVVEPQAPSGVKRTWRQRIEDRTVQASVRTRLLYHKQFKGLKIGARVERGVVTLTGVVATEALKRRMGEVALNTRGVDLIVNDVTVRPKEEVGPMKRAGRQVADEWVEKRVETSILLNRHLSVRRVDVEVDDGVCILTGTVASEAERKLAGSVAENIQGVGTVRNELRVRGIVLPDLEILEPGDEAAGHAGEAPMETLEPVEEMETLEPDEGPRVRSRSLSP